MSLQHSYSIRFFEEKQELFSIFQIFSFAEAAVRGLGLFL